MDENTENIVEQEAEVDEFDTAFDSGWDDDDGFDDAEDAQTDEADDQTEETEEDGDDGASENNDGEQEEAEPEQRTEAEAGKEQNQLFTIKVNGQERQLTNAEMVELAQKGADYDRVRQERDSFKTEAPTIQKLRGYEAFLKELADSADMDIESLVDQTRARRLIADAEAKGETLTEEDALKQVREKAKSAEAAEKKGEAKKDEPAEETQEQKRSKAFAAFVNAYPDVDPKAIDKGVWADFEKTGNLVDAYQKGEIKKLREENQQLKQNEKNKQRSTGSRRTAGATIQKDAFEEGWDSDF